MVSERKLIERISRKLEPRPGSGVVLGIGDDCAVFRPRGAGEDLLFTTDLLNDDQPYLIETRSGKKMVSIPYTSEVNDFTVFMRQGQDVEGALRVFKEQFDWLYRESAESGRLMNIGLHPHVVGQPFRIRALQDFLAYISSFDGVWFASREEIAQWYLDNHHTHIAL